MDRPRVVEAVRRAAARPVTLVSAPIGYGKSRAVAEAFEGVPIHRAPADAASLADVALAFADAIASGMRGIHLAFSTCARRAYAASEPWSVFASWLAEPARAHTQPLVVDDCERVLSVPGVPAFLDALVTRSASSARWVLVTRTTATLPVTRWHAEGIATVAIDDGVLALRPEEVTRYAELRDVERGALVGVEPRPATVALACDLLHAGSARRDVTAHGGVLRTLVELVFADADPTERRLLALAARLARLDDVLLSALPVTAARSVHATLRARLPSAFEGLAFATWFRSAILARSVGDPARSELDAEAIDTYERAGRPLDALRLALQSGDLSEVAAIVARHGERFLDAGTPPAVVVALAQLDLSRDDVPMLAMRGIVETQQNLHEPAEAHFEAAIARASGGLRATIVHRYALELIRRGRLNAIPLLEREVATGDADPVALAPLRATLATAYAIADRHRDAELTIARSAVEEPRVADEAVRARMVHQRAFVALKRGDVDEARNAAYGAIALAESSGTYDVAARAHTVLYELAYDADDPAGALAALEGVAHYAALAGEAPLRTFALLGAYDLEATRGDEDAMRRIEEALSDFEVDESREGATRALLAGRALGRAWRGDALGAYELLAGTALGESEAGMRAVRWAEIACYAAAAGLAIEAREAIASAVSDLHQVSESARRDRVVASLALAHVLLGEDASAARLLPNRPAGPAARRTAILLDAVSAYRARTLGRVGATALLEVLERVRERGFGGFARFVQSLPRRPVVATGQGG